MKSLSWRLMPVWREIVKWDEEAQSEASERAVIDIFNELKFSRYPGAMAALLDALTALVPVEAS